MRAQFFLLATAVIIGFLYIALKLQTSQSYALAFANNFENEITYIVDNFGLEYVGDYTQKFKNYLLQAGYNFTFVCWTNSEKITISECRSGNNKNCCYKYEKNKIITINIPGKNVVLYPVKEWICFYYNISAKDEFVSKFFCT